MHIPLSSETEHMPIFDSQLSIKDSMFSQDLSEKLEITVMKMLSIGTFLMFHLVLFPTLNKNVILNPL